MKAKEYARQNRSQAHLCVCHNGVFEDSITNGVYGFPHAYPGTRKKSFWRAISSMYNIGPHDLIFIYRRKGENPGCGEIHGPFKVHDINQKPAIYYDAESESFQIQIPTDGGRKDCMVRFLFESLGNKVFSITNNYELVKKYEQKEIWGYRHPAVMNIGAARKKSVTAYTNKQALLLLELMDEFGELRHELSQDIPLQARIDEFNSIPNDGKHFVLDDDFLLSQDVPDEAFLYAYILRSLKTPSSFRDKTVEDFSSINDEMLGEAIGKGFVDMTVNAMMEVVISPHLQDELDLVLLDEKDANMLILEVKLGPISQEDVSQTQKYLDLVETIFPKKGIFANIVGSDADDAEIDSEFSNSIRLVKYEVGEDRLGFEEIED